MGDIGVPELLIILGIVIVIFGPSKLAGLGKALGTSIKELRRSLQDGETDSRPAADEGAVPGHRG